MTNSHLTDVVDGQAQERADAERKTLFQNLEAFQHLTMSVMNVLGFESQEELETWLANPHNDGVRQDAARYRQLKVMLKSCEFRVSGDVGTISVAGLDTVLDAHLAYEKERAE